MLNELCPVCFLDKYTDNCLFIKLKCGHTICETCYYEWHIKLAKPTCVVCRKINVITHNPEHQFVYRTFFCKYSICSGICILFLSGIFVILTKIIINNYIIKSICLAFGTIGFFIGLFNILLS